MVEEGAAPVEKVVEEVAAPAKEGDRSEDAPTQVEEVAQVEEVVDVPAEEGNLGDGDSSEDFGDVPGFSKNIINLYSNFKNIQSLFRK